MLGGLDTILTESNASMDIYVDKGNRLKLFFSYLEDDKKRRIFSNALKDRRLVRLFKGEDEVNILDKDLKSSIYFYEECLEQLKKYEVNNYITFHSKRTGRYLDKDTFSFSKGFGVDRKYIIPISDRLNELQIHTINEEGDAFEQISTLIPLYDDIDTLFSFQLNQIDEVNLDQVENFTKNIIQYATAGIKRIVFEEEKEDAIIKILNKLDYANDLSLNFISAKKVLPKSGSTVGFFCVAKDQIKIRQYCGVIQEINDQIATVIIGDKKEKQVPLKSLINLINYGPNARIKSPINWYGGKYKLAPHIINIFPKDCRRYIEVFGGAGHVLFTKEYAPEENIYNDINKGLYTFFKILSDPKKKQQLMDKLILTLYHQSSFENSIGWEYEKEEIELAKKFYIETMQAISSNGGWSYTRNKEWSRRNMTASVSKWLGNIENNIHRAASKLSNITIQNDSFEKCIEKYDDEDALFYLDPPYVQVTRSLKRGYLHEMTEEQHEKLVDILLSVKGKVVLSGYDNIIYKRLEQDGKFKKFFMGEVTKGSNHVNRKESMGQEYIWVNYEIDSLHCIKFIVGELLRVDNDIRKLRKKDIDLVQLEFNFIFPKEYYKFLMDYNGGVMKEEVLHLLKFEKEIYGKVFYGLDKVKQLNKYKDNYVIIGEDIKNRQIGISKLDNKIYLKVRGDYKEIGASFYDFLYSTLKNYYTIKEDY